MTFFDPTTINTNYSDAKEANNLLRELIKLQKRTNELLTINNVLIGVSLSDTQANVVAKELKKSGLV